jgi:Family of unknown function (DUF5519)
MSNIAQLVEKEVLSWPHVTKRRGRFNSTAFYLGEHELGHVHGNQLADLPYGGKTREALLATGQVTPHHIRPELDWVTYRIHGLESASELITFFRANYDYYYNQLAPTPTEQSEDLW